MPPAAMPKTSINENREARMAEDEVGAAREGLLAAPAGDAVASQDGYQFQFGSYVAMRTYGGHDL